MNGPVLSAPHCYRISGWTVAADRPLPYLLATEPVAEPDIVIDLEPWPTPTAPPARDLERFQRHAPDLIDLITPDRIRIHIAEGRRRRPVKQPHLMLAHGLLVRRR